MKKLRFALLLLLLCEATQSYAGNGKKMTLWYTQPASKWDAEGLPIGNGRIGAMMMNGITKDRIQFNEQSLWSGDNNGDGGYDTGDHGFGSYRNFGEYVIDFDHSGHVTNYKRALDIITGIQTTSFESNGITFTREAFASH